MPNSQSPTDAELEQMARDAVQRWIDTAVSVHEVVLAALKSVRDRSAQTPHTIADLAGEKLVATFTTDNTGSPDLADNNRAELERMYRRYGITGSVADAFVIPEALRDMDPQQRAEFVHRFNSLTGEEAMEMARRARKAAEIYPSHPVRCPYGNHPIFVRPSGSIVAHYGDAAPGSVRCKGSERQYCDCHLHERQVCDICQGVTGNECDAVQP